MISVRLKTVIMSALVAVVLMQIFPGGSLYAMSKEEKKKQELEQKIEELKRQKRLQQEEFAKKREDELSKTSGKSLKEVIDSYDKVLQGSCAQKKSERCADVISSLAKLYYDDARDGYIKMRADYEKAMDEWEKKKAGPEPINPRPDYSKASDMYKRLIAEYPDYPRIDEAYYQLGSISLIFGDLEESAVWFERLIKETPKSRRASAAYFRLGDFSFLQHDHAKALKYFEKVSDDDVNLEIVEMVHYRKAECYYNVSDFDRAADLYFNYREKCDRGTYTKCEFRNDALEFLAVTFADMGRGGEQAEKFFKKVGGRPYEDYVFYTIGMKNRVHGQYEDAIHSLSVALNRFPYYKDAPLAQQMLVECYLVKKEYEKANNARERLVDDYAPGSEWYRRNEMQRAAIEQSQNEVRRALAAIPVYYHARAQKEKERSLFEKALARYEEYFKKFPDDKWRVFEFHYNIAEIYNHLRQYEKAAQYYDFVASENIAAYPDYKVDVDTIGLDQEEIEKEKKRAREGPKSISQEDAGYNVIVAYDNARKQKIAQDGITDEQAYALAETQKFLEYIDTFVKRFPKSANAADVLYLAGNVHYSSKNFERAIGAFQYIIDNYPTSKLVERSLRMLANSYSNSGNFDLAMAKYRELLSKMSPGSSDYEEVVELAAGAMFKKAEDMKKSGNLLGGADAFKAIHNSYPASKVAARGWFEAGTCLENAGNLEAAAGIFESLHEKFPKSELVEGAFVKAGEIYKNEKKWEKAAQVYIKAANAISKAEYAIPSLSSAAECYQNMEKFEQAGKMFELIYQRYSDDPKTPQALYNAGLIFEKGEYFESAIRVYRILSDKFPRSEYAGEAFFSIGLCYEKMGKKQDMAGVFGEFAKKYSGDRFKQVEALAKAADAYFDLKNYSEAEKNYTLATVVHKEYGGKHDIDLGTVSRSFYMLGEIKYRNFLDIKLTGNNEKDVKAKTKEKTDVLGDAAKFYARAIELGVEKWTVQATYRIGESFVDMAEAVRNQRLFGNQEQQIASKIKILSSLDKYYGKAQEYFVKNVEWAYEQGISGEYVDKSKDKFMEMLYKKGYLLEEVGVTFKEAPIPKGLDTEERQAYKELLEEKYLEALDAALPKYEEAIRITSQVGIARSPWLDKIQERIRAINPASEALAIQIAERQMKAPVAGAGVKGVPGKTSVGDSREVQQDFERTQRRIQNIIEMNIPADEKLKQLSRIEREAKRDAIMEEEKIKELKEKTGTK